MSGEARLIRACADLLNLPQRVTATALVFYHRFQQAADEQRRLDSQVIGCTDKQQAGGPGR